MSLFCGLGHRSLFAFQVAIVDHLQATHVLLLHGPQAFLFLALVLKELLLTQLLFSLVENRRLLLVVHSFEVIGFDTVGREHRGHGGGVLGHQVMI